MTGLGRLGPETAHEIHLALNFGAQALGLTFPLLLKLLLQFHELAERRLAENRFRAAEVQHVRPDPVHEHAVVGHEEQRALVIHEKIFQPFHRLDVEVVGRFVEQQDIGPGDQHPGQLCTLTPAAGQLLDRQVPLALVESQTGQHGLRLVFRIVAVQGLKFGLPRTEARNRGLVLGGHRRFPCGPEVMPVRQNVHHPFEQRRV